MVFTPTHTLHKFFNLGCCEMQKSRIMREERKQGKREEGRDPELICCYRRFLIRCWWGLRPNLVNKDTTRLLKTDIKIRKENVCVFAQCVCVFVSYLWECLALSPPEMRSCRHLPPSNSRSRGSESSPCLSPAVVLSARRLPELRKHNTTTSDTLLLPRHFKKKKKKIY